MATNLDSAETTNWLAPAEQQFWFAKFATLPDRRDDGNSFLALNFQQFQSFLKSAIYCYIDKFPTQSKITSCNGTHKNQHVRSSHLNDSMTKLNLTSTDLKLEDSSAEFSKQQEMHLFKKFDLNNDHLIDRDEFGQLCQKWLQQVYNPLCALVVVDVQNDFIDGSLALINGPAKQDGAEVIPIVNELVEAFEDQKATIVYTQDWHPQDHVSFYENLHLRKYTTKDREHTNNNHALDHSCNEQVNASSNDKDVIEDGSQVKDFKYKRFVPKANLFDTVLFEDGRVEQKLWPIHCIRNSWGAQFHPKLKLVPDSIRIQKGTLSHVDAYSAFWDNMRMNETGLRQELANKRITDLFFCGLALDYCVAASALDAAKAGFITFVIDDACRGIDEQEIDRRKQQLRDHGAFIVDGSIALNYLKRTLTTKGDLDSNPDVELSKQYLSRSLIKTIIYRKASC